jgi:hypothetical protein
MASFTQPFTLESSSLIFTSVDIPVGDQSISISPVTNPIPTLSSLNVTGQTASGGTREFLVNIGLISSSGAPPQAGGVNDKVALFSGLDAHAGTSDVWSIYTGVAQTAGSGDYHCHGYEADINNFNVDRGNSGNLNVDFGGKITNGISITGAGTKSCTTGMLVSSQSGHANAQWNRGISLVGSYGICTIEDWGSAPIGYQFDGSYATAAINLTSVYGNPGATTPTALLMKNNQQISWQNAATTNVISDKTDPANNRYVGIGSAGVFCGASCSPIASGLNLGSPSNFWGQVWSSNGIVNPSDLALKSDVQPLHDVSDMIKAIDPIAFRWKDGLDGMHYGFNAAEVKSAMPDDFAGHIEAGGVGHLIKDELIAVLWASNRELLRRVDVLEAAFGDKGM